MSNQLGHLSSGETVIDRPRSHLNPTLARLLAVALQRVSTHDQKTIETDVDFGKPIGHSNLVETNETDEIVFAKRPGRKGYSRLVKHKQGSEVTTLHIKLLRAKELNTYVLVTAFLGTQTPPEPPPGSNSSKLKQFWSTHALSYENVKTIRGTETKIPPPEFSQS